MKDQVTGQLEVRASSDEAAQAGQDIIQGFLNDPEIGAVFRSALAAAAQHKAQACDSLHDGRGIFSLSKTSHHPCLGMVKTPHGGDIFVFSARVMHSNRQDCCTRAFLAKSLMCC